MSPAWLRSTACDLKYRYAVASERPVLPLRMATIAVQALRPDLAAIQNVDYREPGTDAAWVNLVNALAPIRPIPPPENGRPRHLYHCPISPTLGQQVSGPNLGRQEQSEVLVKLRTALASQDEQERAAGETVLTMLRSRSDLYASTEQEIQMMFRLPPQPTPAGWPPPFPPGPGAVPGQPNGPTTSGLAIASLVLGLVWCYGIGSVLAIILGVRAKKQSGNGERSLGDGMATAGIVLRGGGIGRPHLRSCRSFGRFLVTLTVFAQPGPARPIPAAGTARITKLSAFLPRRYWTLSVPCRRVGTPAGTG